MKTIQYLIILTLVVLIISSVAISGAFASCADCVVGIVPMAGSGPSVNGRRSISIKIASNFNISSTTTHPAIWNAVFGCTGCSVLGAIRQWNDTTDNGQSNGNHIGYFLKQDQSASIPDIFIVKVPAGSLNRGAATPALGH